MILWRVVKVFSFPKMGIYILKMSYKFAEIKVLYLTLKSVWVVEMTKFVHWTCINIKNELKKFCIYNNYENV